MRLFTQVAYWLKEKHKQPMNAVREEYLDAAMSRPKITLGAFS
jgi:hypothetical protein